MSDKRSRKEHIEWCKERAMKSLKVNGYASGVASMLSDLEKHPETKELAKSTGFLILTIKNKQSAMRFIKGFN